MKILFSGGGTLGSVTPLLALAETVREKEEQTEFLWVGTKQGPERELLHKAGIRFVTLSSGKYRRYISFWNVVDVFRILLGFFQSIALLRREKPSVCITAGGFISVPVHYAAWILGIPTWVHQQDMQVGLANALMAKVATRITTALQSQVDLFKEKKGEWLGNPVRHELFLGERQAAKNFFSLNSGLPVVLVTGGGTGSARVNQLIVEAVPHLEGFCEVVHLSGKERNQEAIEKTVQHFSFYHSYHFLVEEMKDAYAVADIVVSRGGFGTLTELAAFKKCAVIIPKPGHQEENVRFLALEDAVLVCDEETTNGIQLATLLKDLLEDVTRRKKMGETMYKLLPPASKEKISLVLQSIVNRS